MVIPLDGGGSAEVSPCGPLGTVAVKGAEATLTSGPPHRLQNLEATSFVYWHFPQISCVAIFCPHIGQKRKPGLRSASQNGHLSSVGAMLSLHDKTDSGLPDMQFYHLTSSLPLYGAPALVVVRPILADQTKKSEVVLYSRSVFDCSKRNLVIG